jgi:hypothetical protein
MGGRPTVKPTLVLEAEPTLVISAKAEGEGEGEGEGNEKEKRRADASAPANDSEWLGGLKADPAWAGVDIDREFARMRAWCQQQRKQPTRRRFVNWLLRCERPIGATSTPVKAYI